MNEKYRDIQNFNVHISAGRLESTDANGKDVCASLSAADVTTVRSFRSHILTKYKNQVIDFGPGNSNESRSKQHDKFSSSPEFIRLPTSETKVLTIYLDSFGKDSRILPLLDIAASLFPSLKPC